MKDDTFQSIARLIVEASKEYNIDLAECLSEVEFDFVKWVGIFMADLRSDALHDLIQMIDGWDKSSELIDALRAKVNERLILAHSGKC